MVSAFSALPEILNTLNSDIDRLLRLLAGDRELQLGDSRIDEVEAGLIAHVVLGERRLLHRHLDGVAVERGLVGIAVLQIADRQRPPSSNVMCADVRDLERQLRSRLGCARAPRRSRCRAPCSPAYPRWRGWRPARRDAARAPSAPAREFRKCCRTWGQMLLDGDYEARAVPTRARRIRRPTGARISRRDPPTGTGKSCRRRGGGGKALPRHRCRGAAVGLARPLLVIAHHAKSSRIRRCASWYSWLAAAGPMLNLVGCALAAVAPRAAPAGVDSAGAELRISAGWRRSRKRRPRCTCRRSPTGSDSSPVRSKPTCGCNTAAGPSPRWSSAGAHMRDRILVELRCPGASPWHIYVPVRMVGTSPVDHRGARHRRRQRSDGQGRAHRAARHPGASAGLSRRSVGRRRADRCAADFQRGRDHESISAGREGGAARPNRDPGRRFRRP